MRILFVCHGNICRSTMAEFVMKDLVEKAGLTDIEIASAGTSSEELGNPVHYGTRQKLAEHGISCAGKFARQMNRSDYAAYDLLIGMDNANIRNLRRMLGGDPQGKVCRLMDFTDRPGEVSDPWYSDRFDVAYADIMRGCKALIEYLENEKGEDA